MSPSSVGRGPQPLNRRQFLRVLAGAGVGVGALGGLAGAGVAQARAQAQINTYTYALRGLQEPVTLALLTDLHYGHLVHLPQVRGWVDRALTIRPDAFLLLGDFVDVLLWEALPTDYLNELGRLKAPLGVYGVWGNHDYGSFGAYQRLFRPQPPAGWQAQREKFGEALAAKGIRILREEGLSLRPDLYLGGVDDLWWGESDAAKAFAAAPADSARILMSHNPDYLMNLDPKLLPPDSGLMVSGHTHGGQVRLPFVGALQVPSQYGQRFAQGWVAGEMGARGFVSRGLGLSGLPVRNMCPPEIVVLRLMPQAG